MQRTVGKSWFGLIFPIFVVAGITYFAYAAIQGDYGTFRRVEVEAQGIKLTRELTQLRAEKADLVNRTRRLSSDSLDLDLLDEQARKVLGLSRGDDVIIR